MSRQIITSVAALVAGLPAYALASPVNSLYNFTGSPDGASPIGALVADSAGNLYGTTTAGGINSAKIVKAGSVDIVGPPPPSGAGTVFELSPPAAGSSTWTETILYTFQGGTTGAYPVAGSLAIDAKGNLYGTTESGGASARYDGGMVFELVKPKKGSAVWTEKKLTEFNGAGILGKTTVPYAPNGAVVFGPDGALYGTTSAGGAHNQGVVYRLALPHTLSVIYNFGANSTDGSTPYGSVVFDKAGNLYTPTFAGGNTGNGTVVELSPPGAAGVSWTETLLHSFDTNSDGGAPRMGLTIDAKGNLYGTSAHMANNAQTGQGAVYELSPPAAGSTKWAETVLNIFPENGNKGASPGFSTVTVDKSGNLYGTTEIGGTDNGGTTVGGTLWRLSPPTTGSGSWTQTTLNNFTGEPAPARPEGGVIFLSNGDLVGTTFFGGVDNIGTVYSYTP
jgi:uncharacterized repeat protein (TIGR03803 family)